jgi:para-aminobenzoate synthetase / 4-amino-4-deoxychorismate lyase
VKPLVAPPIADPKRLARADGARALVRLGAIGDAEAWHAFTGPRTVLSAARPSEVLPLLAEIERATFAGLHAVGFIAFEAATAFDSALATRAGAGPLARFALFAEARPWLPGRLPPWPIAGNGAWPRRWQPSVTPAAHRRAIDSVRQAIARGDVYQVSYTYRLRAPWAGDPWLLFRRLLARQPVPHAAYLDFGDQVVCSASPELFFALEGERIASRPMKGTAARGRWTAEDEACGAALAASAKERAENLMIVDMVRNDLGRIARPGSVEVPRLFDVERYATLWQMTSTVTARTAAPLPEILAALFPAASITGAPKASAMGQIAALEEGPRGVYTGAVGWLGPGRRAELNVAIRTAVIDRASGRAEYGTGGGVVWDSEPAAELAEARVKARVLSAPALPPFRLLETMLWRPGRGWWLLAGHLDRLASSARYFGFPLPGGLRQRLDAFAAGLPAQRHRLRLLLSRDGTVALESAPLERRAGRWRVALAAAPVDGDDPLLFHKTTHRAHYRRALAAAPAGCDDVLLWNRRGELTESTRANLVLELAGERVTPALACGLLPGVYRERLLGQGRIREGVLRREDLERATAVWLVSSVRGWVPAEVRPGAQRR